MSNETIKRNIENLNKLKSILKDKINNVDLQLQREKTRLSKEKEKQKLNHIKSQENFQKNT